MKRVLIALVLVVLALTASAQRTIKGKYTDIFKVGCAAIDYNFNKQSDENERMYSNSKAEIVFSLIKEESGNGAFGIQFKTKDKTMRILGNCGDADIKVTTTSTMTEYYAMKDGMMIFYATKNKKEPEKSLVFVLNPFILKVLE